MNESVQVKQEGTNKQKGDKKLARRVKMKYVNSMELGKKLCMQPRQQTNRQKKYGKK